MGQRLPVFSDEIPTYEVRGGIMFIRREGLEIAVPVSVCVVAIARMRQALDEWHERQCEVIEFPTQPH